MKRTISLLFWFCVWALLAYLVSNPLILPGPLDAFRACIELLVSGNFWAACGFTIIEIAIAFFAAFILGCALGIISSTSKGFAVLMEPFIAGCKSIPVACLTVILMLFAGPFFLILAVVFLLVFPAYYTAAQTAYIEFGASKLHVLSSYGLTSKQIIFAYAGPYLLGYLRAISNSVVAMSWKAAIAAQVIGLLGVGLGDMVYRSKVILDIPQLFALTIFIVLFSFIAERSMQVLLKILQRQCTKRAIHVKKDTHMPAPKALVAEHISIAYGNNEIVNDAALSVEPGDILLLTGKTGSGKTSVFTYLAKTSDIRIGVLTQDGFFPPALTAIEAVVLLRSQKEGERLLSTLFPKAIPFEPLQNLSGGQVRLVELAIVLASHTSVLLLDEPFKGMDSDTKALAIRAILMYAKRRPLIISAHSTEDANALGAKVLEIAKLG